MSIDIAAPFENAKYSEFDGQFIKIDENYTEVTESGVFTGEFVDGVINEFEKDGKLGALLSMRLADRESQTFVSTSITWVSYKTARHSVMAHTLMLLAYDPYIRELTVLPEIKTITTKTGKSMTVLDLPPGTVFKAVLDFDGTTRQLNNGNVVYNNNCLGIFSASGFTPLEMRDGKQEPEKLKKALERLENNQRERAAKTAAMNGRGQAPSQGQGQYQQPQQQYGGYQGQQQQQQPMPNPQQFTQQWNNQAPPPPPVNMAPPQSQYPQQQQRNYGRPQQQSQYAPKPSNVPTPEQRQQVQGQAGSFNAQAGQWQPNNVPPPPASMAFQQPAKPQNFKDDDLPF